MPNQGAGHIDEPVKIHHRAAAEGAFDLDCLLIGSIVGYEWGNKNGNVLFGAIAGFNVFDVSNKRGNIRCAIIEGYHSLGMRDRAKDLARHLRPQFEGDLKQLIRQRVDDVMMAPQSRA